MTAAVDTELDAQTIAEIEAAARQPCEIYANHPAHPEQCPAAANYVIRFTMACGESDVWLLCTPHTKAALGHPHQWVCVCGRPRCTPRAIHWELL